MPGCRSPLVTGSGRLLEPHRLEGYERLLTSMLEFEEQAAKGTGADWATSLASTHANLVRQTSEVFLGGLRQQLKS